MSSNGHLERLAIRSQEEVGKALGISRSRVAQLEAAAFRKLKKALAKKFGKATCASV